MNFYSARVSLIIASMCLVSSTYANEEPAYSIQSKDGRYFQIIDDMRIEVDGDGLLSVLRKDVRKWKDGILPIKFEEDYKDDEKISFFNGCSRWSAYSKVKCVEKKDFHKDYILVVSSDETNSSAVGRIGGEQELKLLDRNNEVVIAHEIAHALGFTHQHNSPERDKFVRIEWDNIRDGSSHNFDIVSERHSVVFGFYDYCSIMHYSKTGLSKDASKYDTITVIGEEPDCTMGQRKNLTDSDKMGMADAYGRDPDDTFLIRVPDFQTIHAADIGKSEHIFRRYGVRPVLIEGNLNEPWCTEGVCEWTCYRNEIYWQFPEPNSAVEFGTAVSLKSRRISEAQFGPPPNGQRCE